MVQRELIQIMVAGISYVIKKIEMDARDFPINGMNVYFTAIQSEYPYIKQKQFFSSYKRKINFR